MRNILTKECKEFLADKKIRIGFVLVLIIIIIGTSYNWRSKKNEDRLSSDSGQLKLGVVNQDKSVYSELMLSYFKKSGTFTSLITVIQGKEKDIKDSFQNGVLDIYMIIPENFAESMMVLEHKPITVNINIQDTTKAIIVSNILKSYEKYIEAVEANAVGLYEIMRHDGMEKKVLRDTNQTISMDMVLTALGKEAFFSYHPVTKFPATKIAVYYMISALIMIWMYAGLYVGFQILNELEQGTFMRLMTTNTGIVTFVLAKMLLMAMVLTILTTFACQSISNTPISVTKILFGLSVSMVCVTFAAFLCALFPVSQRYLLAGNLFVFLFMILGGGMIPLQFLPQGILRIAGLTPNYHMIKGFLLLKQGTDSEVILILCGFFVVSLLFFSAAVLLLNRRRMQYE